MLYTLHGLYILLYLIAIIYSCSLFTNAIENLGQKLKISDNATGSILAVIGTTLPETIVPFVAIFSVYIFGYEMNVCEDLAIGAIIGSPFMLVCFGMFLIGAVLLIKKRSELKIGSDNILRDYKYFLLVYSIAISSSFLQNQLIKHLIALLLIFIYCFFVFRTMKKSKENFVEHDTDELIFSKIFSKFQFLKTPLIYLQIIVSILCLIIFSHFFMDEIIWFSNILKVSPLILSMIVTPFATELPECVNSIIWVFEDKDELAVGNVLGAIIFQGSVLAAIGILLTSWTFDWIILLNSIFVIVSALIFIISFAFQKRATSIMLLLCGLFYFGYFLFIFLKSLN